MHERFEDEELSLHDLAAAAFSSPYHFERLFRRITGVPPCHFLAALRMEAAKRLLVNTGLSVTEVCLDVGYSSLGTFTRRFGELVGLSPRRFRALARALAGQAAAPDAGPMHALRLWSALRDQPDPPARALAGRLQASNGFSGAAFVGLFTSPAPEGRPVGCTIALAPGPYRIDPVPDGAYFVMAASLSSSTSALAQLLGTGELRGRVGPIRVKDGLVTGQADVELRPPLSIDPPIVIAPAGLLHVMAAMPPPPLVEPECAREPGDDGGGVTWER